MLKQPFIFRNLLVIALLLAFASCKKKYPDGPLFSFSSKLKRVSDNWTLNAALVNGVDKMSYPGFAFCKLKLTDNMQYTVQWREKNLEFNTLGTWKWVDRKKSIQFSTDLWFYKFDPDHNLVSNTYNNSQPTLTTYRINKLTKKELWLESTSGSGDHVELGFIGTD